MWIWPGRRSRWITFDPDTLSQLVSEHYSRMVLTVEADYEGEDTFRLVSEIRAVAESHYPGQWHLAGEGVSTYDLMNTVTRDMVKVNLVAILAVFAVLCWPFCARLSCRSSWC